MGFYAPAQIVRDARTHEVEVRPLDVNLSAWDSTLEPRPESRDGFALRLGLRVTAGLSQEDGKRLIKVRDVGNGRPFASVEEAAMQAELSRKALEALVEADSLAGLASLRRRARWDAATVDIKAPADLPLFAAAEGPHFEEPAPALGDETVGEAVAADYRATGLTLRQHPLAPLRPALSHLGLHDTRFLRTPARGRRCACPASPCSDSSPEPQRVWSSSPWRMSTGRQTSVPTRPLAPVIARRCSARDC
jgi:error-prone DNA polymerase